MFTAFSGFNWDLFPYICTISVFSGHISISSSFYCHDNLMIACTFAFKYIFEYAKGRQSSWIINIALPILYANVNDPLFGHRKANIGVMLILPYIEQTDICLYFFDLTCPVSLFICYSNLHAILINRLQLNMTWTTSWIIKSIIISPLYSLIIYNFI